MPWRIMNQMKGTTKHADSNEANQPSPKTLFCVLLFLINKGVISYCDKLEQCYIIFMNVVAVSDAVLTLLANEELTFSMGHFIREVVHKSVTLAF